MHYYYCNRSGKYTCKSLGKRQTKIIGSAKVGEQCTAHMKVNQHILTGEISVRYCRTHHNHALNLGHLRLPESTRIQIAAKLQQGITIERIMDDIRDSVSEISRVHITTRQDINNIKNHYNIEGILMT